MLRNAAASIRRLRNRLRKLAFSRWVLSFPVSAQVTFLLGLLLAALAASEQLRKIFVRLRDSPTDSSFDFSDWRAVGILLLSLALAVAASWYGLDQRTLSRWSGVLKDLRTELTELESVHPDVLATVLESVHPETTAAELERELRDSVKELSQELASANRAPSQTAVDRVRMAADAATAVGPIPGDTGASWMDGDSAEVSAAWGAMIRLRDAASTTTEEFKQPAFEAPTPGKESGALPEGSTIGPSWGQAVPLATLLVGLIAAPAVVAASTEEAEPPTEGTNPPTSTTTTPTTTTTTTTTTRVETTTAEIEPEPTTTVATTELPRSDNLTEAEVQELQDLIRDPSGSLTDSLTAAVVEASDFDCSGFYETIINIHRDHRSLPETMTESAHWQLTSKWCGDGRAIIQELNRIGR